MNGLLNGNIFYYKALSEAVEVGPGPFTNGGSVTFEVGPVSGEGAAVFTGGQPQYLRIPFSAGNALQLSASQDATIMAWFRMSDLTVTQDIIVNDTFNFQWVIQGAGRDDFSVGDVGFQVTNENAINQSGGPDYTNTTADTWHQIIAQWPSSTRLMRYKLDGGAWNDGPGSGGLNPLPGTGIYDPSGDPSNNPPGNDNAFYFSPYTEFNPSCKLGSFGKWSLLLTDEQCSDLWGSGAGLPFSAFDSGIDQSGGKPWMTPYSGGIFVGANDLGVRSRTKRFPGIRGRG